MVGHRFCFLLVTLTLSVTLSLSLVLGQIHTVDEEVSKELSRRARDPRILSFFQNIVRPALSSVLTNSLTQATGNNVHPQFKQEVNNGNYINNANYNNHLLSATGENPGDLFNNNNNNPTTATSTSGGLESLLTRLGLGEDFSLATLYNMMNYGNMEGIVDKVSKFDKLQCIPRLMCQMIAKRNEDNAKTSTTSTTTTTTARPKKKSRGLEGETNQGEKPGAGQPWSNSSGRWIKFQGVDTAIEQFVKFLELMNMKDWSFYPYLNGAYQGSQVSKSDECAGKFATCPFSDDQLVYYFNNYNGGFFQSFRSSS